MASSKLGRLRQWAEEKISSKEKPAVNEEFKELEKDIELRKEGIQRLILASQKYHHALSKKKSCGALDDAEKMLPIDILGMVMILHGEEFGEDSPFGTALVKLGRAHCKVATLQEAFALTFKDTFLVSMERFRDEIKEYELLKKKLESRRLALEAAAAKFEKLQHSKKEKDRREAEDELERTKQRYEETAEDMRAHMHAIQENEHGQFRELVTFLDLEMNFVQSYLDVLKDVKSDVESHERSESSRSNYSSATTSTSDKDAYFQSLRPSHSVPSTPLHRARAIAGLPPRENTNRLGIQTDASTTTFSVDSSEDDGDGRDEEDDGDGVKTPSRRSSKRSHSRSESTGSRRKEKDKKDKDQDKTPSSSRPASRLSLSRRRTNSSANPAQANARANAEVATTADEKKEGERSRRMSLGGWASSAVESVTGKSSSSGTGGAIGASASTGSLGRTGRRKSKDKESFTALGDEDEFEASRTSLDNRADNSEGGTLRKSGSFRGLTRRKSKSKSKDPTPTSSPSLSHSSSSISVPSTFSYTSTEGSGSTGTSTPTTTRNKILKPPSLQDRRKVVRALYDFTSSSPDELSFKAGEEIVVLQEVVDEWWLGEVLGGDEGDSSSSGSLTSFEEGEKRKRKRKGLFPRTYTEVVGTLPGSAPGGMAGSGVSVPSSSTDVTAAVGKPKNPRRGSSGQSTSTRSPGGFIASLFGGGGGSSSSPPKAGAALAAMPKGRDTQAADDSEQEHGSDHEQHRKLGHDHYLASDTDQDEHLRIVGAQPMMIKSPVYYGRFDQVGQGPNEVDRASFTDQDSVAEGDSMAESEDGDDAFGFKKQMRKLEEKVKGSSAEQTKPKWNLGGGGRGSSLSLSSDDSASLESGSSASLVRGGAEGADGGNEEDVDVGWDVVPPTSADSAHPLLTRPAPSTPQATPRRNPLKVSDQLQVPAINMARSLSDNPVLLSDSASNSTPMLAPSSSSASTASMSSAASATPRKIPPPPPPRRTVSHTPGSNPPPAIPERSVRPSGASTGVGHRNTPSQSRSLGSSSASLDVMSTLRPRSSQGQSKERGGGGIGYDRSPFESALELGLESGGGDEEGKKRAESGDVTQNPF